MEQVNAQHLRDAATLLERLTTCVPGVLYQFRVGPDGTMSFPYSSEGMRRIYRVEPEEVEHDAAAVLAKLHRKDFARVRASIATSAENLSVWRDRYRVVDEDGSVRWLQGEANPEREDDGGTLWHGYIRDITHEVEREERLEVARREALAAARAKSSLLANVGHEIRTPLGAILGYAEVLEERAHARAAGAAVDTSDDEIETIRTIRRNGEHLLTLLNDLLDVSKIEAGRLEIEPRLVDPHEVVSDVVATMRIRADAKGLYLRASGDGEMPDTIVTDPTRLRQILINLVSNGIKFTEFGGVSLRYRCEGRSLLFEVSDTGIGMTRAELEKVRRFEAFTQADASTTRRFGGTGLGLMLSDSLVKRLGGRLEVDSTSGVGSVFRFSIDIGDNAARGETDADSTETRASEANADTPLEGMLVLLADDGPDNRRLIGHHLRRAGAEVIEVHNGREAVRAILASTRPVSMVLMDVMMPEMDGIEATRALRNAGFGAPILAVTAHADDDHHSACLEAGCDARLTKPIGGSALVEACRAALMMRGAA
ncbi:MAG: hypothetical protein Tsb0013_09950 [Phycisphaerales bacterium]